MESVKVLLANLSFFIILLIFLQTKMLEEFFAVASLLYFPVGFRAFIFPDLLDFEVLAGKTFENIRARFWK